MKENNEGYSEKSEPFYNETYGDDSGSKEFKDLEKRQKTNMGDIRKKDKMKF